jgi:hypothetical protein
LAVALAASSAVTFSTKQGGTVAADVKLQAARPAMAVTLTPAAVSLGEGAGVGAQGGGGVEGVARAAPA